MSPNVADADSQDCPPAGEVRSGKKRKRTGAQRAAKKAALEANLDKGRIAYDEGRDLYHPVFVFSWDFWIKFDQLQELITDVQ